MIFLPGNDVVQEVTSRQLQAAVYHYAGVFCAQRIAPGDLVALAFNHTWELIPAFLGAIHLGAVPAILPYLDTISGERLEKQVKQMIAAWQVRAVVTLPHYLPAFDFLETAGCPIVALPIPKESSVEAIPVSDRGGDETAYLQLSSGTTGEPKATIIPHRALLNSVHTMTEAWDLAAQDVSVGWLPLHHDMGLIFQVLTPLLGGFLSVLIAPDYWVRRPRILMQAIHRYRGTWTGMPNFAFNHCVRAIRDSDMTGLDLSSWRLLLNGAELIYLNSLQMFYDRFTPYGLGHECLRAVYGMTENVGAISLTPPVSAAESWLVDWVAIADLVDGGSARPMSPHHPEARPIVNCGRLLPGNELKIAAADGVVLPERRVGEVWLRSHSLCPGYYRLENGQIPDNDGWFPTGDIGYLVNGELFICDRKKDIIISAGNHIFPGVIESVGVEVLGERAGGMAAFGVSSAELGTEMPVLVGEVRGKMDEANRIGWIAAIRQQVHCELGLTLADIQLVRRGWLVQTTSAKIARTACRQKYLAEFAPAKLETHPRVPRPNLGTPFIAPRTELEQQLAAIWAELLDLDEVGVNDDFFELGGDSLLAMRLVLAVEQTTGGHVPPPDFFRTPTVGQMAGLLTGGTTAPSPAPMNVLKQQPKKPAQNPVRSVRCRLRHQVFETGPLWRGYGLPYGLGVRLQRLLVAQPFMRHRHAKQLALVDCWAEELGIEGNSEERATISLLANTWLIWRKHALSNPAHLGRWLKISDPHNALKNPPSSAGIVLAVPHVGRVGSIVLEICRRGGRETGKVVGGGWAGSKARSEMLLHTRQVLQCGGVVMVAADGLQGNQTVDVPFWGRQRPFRIGAAELAVTTGAVLLPVHIHFDAQGHIDVEIAAPLIPQAVTPQAQIRELTERYGADYTACWPQFYAAMRWNHLAYNLNLPF